MKTNEFPAHEPPSPTALPRFQDHSRREFLKRLGGGIIVFVTLRDKLAAGDAEAAAAAAARGGNRPGLPTDFNAFLRIAEDGKVTCFTGKIEMGQGPITSLAQMLADELDVPYEVVDVLMGDTELCPWDAGTWGSMTTRFFGPALRAAAAEARGVLVELAAETLDVPPDRLVTRDGMVIDRQDEARRVGYGALTKGRQIERHLAVKPEVKDVSQFRIMGQPKLRRDAREKVTGAARYTADMRLPGMLYARILRPPAHGAKLESVDTEPARAMPGVQVVETGDLIAVLHALPDVAAEALGRIKADFEIPEPHVDEETIFDHLLGVAPPASVAAEGGDLAAGRKVAARTFETTYLNSYVAHACMETHAALATIEGGKATVWASTQNPFGARDKIAQAIGFPAEKVRVITPYVGGGFGGKTSNAQAVEAVQLAQAVGKPVQVMRSREEEFFYDTFRPAAVVKIKSGIDAGGRMTFWDYEVFFAGERGSAHFYTIPNHRTVLRPRSWSGPPGSHPFATGAWRAPSNNTNSFARESQVDIMAAAAGMDPVEFRLQHLGDPRMIRVLRTAAERFAWKPARAPSGRGFGVACGIDAGSYVAAIAEVEVNRETGGVQVERVLCAQEMGIVINPQGATIQIEGCITMGLGYALTEEIHFQGGQILDTNFHRYHLPRFSTLPRIETVLVEAADIPPQGGGEPAIIVMGAVIANAIHDATGARLLQLPMTPVRVKEALRRA